MYKRKVRVLFVSRLSRDYARMAVDHARRLGGAWMEGRAAGTGQAEVGTGERIGLTEDLLGWADLVVTLGGREDGYHALLVPGVRRKHWPVEAAADVEDEIRRRIQGMVGGIRLLAHSDMGPPDD